MQFFRFSVLLVTTDFSHYRENTALTFLQMLLIITGQLAERSVLHLCLADKIKNPAVRKYSNGVETNWVSSFNLIKVM